MERKSAHICVFLLVLDFSVALQTPKPCRPLETQYGTVCKSDDNYCDSLEMEEPQDEEYILVITSGEGDRFYYEKGDLCAQYLANKFVPDAKTILEIDSTTTYQTMQGFGGAWTGTVTTLINEISENLQNCVFSSYFSSDVGMSYSIIRIPIGGCDFDKKPWAYNEYPENDIQLSNFTTLDERDLMRNEQFRELTKISKNQNINYLGTAWSAPRWMKQNDQWFGLLNSQIKPKYYQTWADYHLKWLKLMNGDGIDIWAISTGNQPWFSLLNSVPIGTGWIASYQALWIAEFLGPTLETSKYAKVQIHGFDDNRLSALGWLQEMSNSNQKAFDYLSAIDFHGYADQLTTPDILDEVQSQFPYKQIWYSEMSLGTVSIGADLTAGPLLGSWLRAEELVTIIMNNLNHSTVGYIDKNLILDYQGGPNSVAAYADAPVILSADLTELYKQPMFYILAQFSKFIPPGSVRIDVKISGIDSSLILSLAVLRPDRKIAVFLYNNSTIDIIDITVKDQLKATFNIQLKPKSFNTLIYIAGNSQGYPIPNCLRFINPLHTSNSIWTPDNVINYIKQL